jgi:hypothetical protein
MKKILITILLALSSITFSQTIKPLSAFRTDTQPSNADEIITPVYYKDTNDYFTSFLGTWTSQIGANTFVVTFWKETQLPSKDDNDGVLYYRDEIFGHYKLVQNYGTSSETIIYTSQINYLNSPTPIQTLIYATSRFYNKLTASIFDVNTISTNKAMGVRGSLEMIATNTIPPTATWIVSKTEEINPGNFVIPTNITLTKQ